MKPHSHLHMRPSLARTVLAVVLLAAVTACSTAADLTQPPDTMPDEVLTLMRFSPDSLILPTDSVAPYTLVGTTTDGKRVVVAGARWHVLDPTVVLLDTIQHTIRALQPGTTAIFATRDGVWDSIAVVVRPPLRLDLDVDAACIRAGFTDPVNARGLDFLNREVPVGPVEWASSDTIVATVDSTGLISAKSAGDATITATAPALNNAQAFVAVQVDPAPLGTPMTCKPPTIS